MVHLRNGLFLSEHGISRTCCRNDQKQTIQGNGHAAFACTRGTGRSRQNRECMGDSAVGKFNTQGMLAHTERFKILRLECETETALFRVVLSIVQTVVVYKYAAVEFSKGLVIIGNALDDKQQ